MWLYIIFVFFFVEAVLRLLFNLLDYGYGMKRKINSYMPKSPPIDYSIAFSLKRHPHHTDKRVVITTNNIGFRGRNLDITQKSDEYRVFILGDSVVADHYHSDEDSFSSKLEKKIKAINKNAAVYCCSYGSETSEDMLATLVHRVVHLQPNLVIILGGSAEFYALFSGRQDFLHLHKNEYKKEWQSTSLKLFLFLSEFKVFSLLTSIWMKAQKSNEMHYSMKQGVLNVDMDFGTWKNEKCKVPLDESKSNLNGLTDAFPLVERNFASLFKLIKGYGIPTIAFGPPVKWKTTPVSILEENNFLYTKLGKTRIRQHIMRKYFDAYVFLIENQCKIENIPFVNLGRVFDKLLPDDGLWVEDIHLSTRGIDELTMNVFDYVANLIET